MQKYKVFVNNKPIIISHEWENFISNFQLVVAAGGYVKNKKREILFIKRNGIWDLPKGKLENNESLFKCAEREVEEECGVNQLTIKEKRCETFYTYKLNGINYLKHTHWYNFECDFNGMLVPQTSEGIELVKWVSQTEIKSHIRNSFKSIQEVVNA